jgi:hypothetical protein
MATNGAGGAIYKDTLGSGRIINFLNGFTGTTPNWTYGTQTTLNIPLAASTVGSGTVSNGVQSVSGNKTLLGNTTLDSGVVVTRSFKRTSTSVTAATTLTAASNNYQIADATGASFILTLPTATDGLEYYIYKSNATVNTVTLAGGTFVGGKVLYTQGIYKVTGAGSSWIVNQM